MPNLDIRQAKVSSQWPHARPLIAVRLDPTGKFAVTSSEDHSLQRWDLSAAAVPAGTPASPPAPTILLAHDSWVHALLFSRDGSTLLSGGCDGRIVWWPITEEQPKPLRTIEAHRGWVRSLAISLDGTQFASCGNDRLIVFWNLSTGEKLFELAGHERDVYTVAFHPDGQHLLSGDLMGKLHIWNLAERKIVRSIDAAPLHTYEGGQRVDFGGIRTLVISPDGSTILAGGLHKASNPLGAVHEPLLMRFDFATGELRKSHIAEGVTGGVIWNCRILSDGTVAAVSGGSSGGLLLFWNPDNEKDIHRLALPNIARDMDLHPDGLRIATSHHDHHLRLTQLFAS